MFMQALVRHLDEDEAVALLKQLSGLGGDAGRGPHLQLLLNALTHALQAKPPRNGDGRAGEASTAPGMQESVWLAADIGAMVSAALAPIAKLDQCSEMLTAVAEAVAMHGDAAVVALNIHRFLLLRYGGKLPEAFACPGQDADSTGVDLKVLYGAVQRTVCKAHAVLKSAGPESAGLVHGLGVLQLAVDTAKAALGSEVDGSAPAV